MKNWKELILLKLKFAMASSLATAVDYFLYLLFVYTIFKGEEEIANIISFSTAVLLNFILQKRYVFDLNRKLKNTFMLAMLISAGGLILSTSIIFGLTKIAFFEKFQFLTKAITTGLIFFYNFYLKRFAFEKKFL